MAFKRADWRNCDEVLEFLFEASRWLEAQGIRQWPGQNYQDPAYKRIFNRARDHQYVATIGGKILGTVTIERDARPWDIELWGEESWRKPVRYLHSLATHRRQVHKEIGRWVIERAVDLAKEERVKKLRLDILADNQRLREYFEVSQFKHVRNVEAQGWNMALYERKV